MRIAISSLEKHAGEFVPFSAQISVAALGIDLAGVKDTVMNISVQASYLGGRVLVKGRWCVELEDACSRCLEQTVYRLEEEFTEEFTRFTGSDSEAERACAVFAVEDSFTYSGEVLDLTEYLRQSFLISQPLKTLCREDCRGLCPVCGVDRNRKECRCQDEKIDPRLRVLEQYKKK